MRKIKPFDLENSQHSKISNLENLNLFQKKKIKLFCLQLSINHYKINHIILTKNQFLYYKNQLYLINKINKINKIKNIFMEVLYINKS